MRRSSLVGHIVELLDLVRTGRGPADGIVRTFFRSRHYLGARDRRSIADPLYDVVRNFLLLEWYARRSLVAIDAGDRFPAVPSLALYAAYEVRLINGGADAFLSELHDLWREALPGVECNPFLQALMAAPGPAAGVEDPPVRMALEFSIPEFIVHQWVERFGVREAEELCRACNQQAPITLRVNGLKCTREECRLALEREGVPAGATSLSPSGLVIERRLNVQDLRVFRLGWFELQDEGSQLLSLLLEPVKGMHVVDACAGGGGKTLHIAALMQNDGELTAIDADQLRLEHLALRARRAGASIARGLLDGRDDAALEALRWTADAVLVDAPCSGSGTLRRNPWIKLHLTRESVDRCVQKQKNVLERYAPLVKPGGRLVYATCSLLREENEKVVEEFTASHPDFSVESAPVLLRNLGVDVTPDTPFLFLRPDQGTTDGYFAAVMRRRVAP